MKNPGPPLESLIDRLITIPDIFFTEPGRSRPPAAVINIPAAVNDLLLDCGGIPLNNTEILKFLPVLKKNKSGKENNYRELAGILCFIYEDSFFTGKPESADLIKKILLSPRLQELSEAVDSAKEFITDPDRREEICRTALDALDYYPGGENEKTASDRLLTLDSVERKKILSKTFEAQKRAKELKEAMLRKEAEEAASKMSRE